MLTTKDVAIVYETLLTSPGMNDAVKVTLTIPRKDVLLLSKVIELGLSMKDDTSKGGLLSAVSGESLDELNTVAADLLKKAGLTEMYDKLNSLQSK
jgi:hypothetical protein